MYLIRLLIVLKIFNGTWPPFFQMVYKSLLMSLFVPLFLFCSGRAMTPLLRLLLEDGVGGTHHTFTAGGGLYYSKLATSVHLCWQSTPSDPRSVFPCQQLQCGPHSSSAANHPEVVLSSVVCVAIGVFNSALIIAIYIWKVSHKYLLI